jgi:hypothetical protein
MPRSLFAGAMVVLLGLYGVLVLDSVVHDVPCCPAGHGQWVMSAWYCNSFLAVSMFFGLVQVGALALSLALMAMARVRLRWGVVSGAVVALSTIGVMWDFSSEALDLDGVENADTLIAGSTYQVVGMDSLLVVLLVAVWAGGMHVLRLRAKSVPRKT